MNHIIPANEHFIPADHPFIRYDGRIDFEDPKKPCFTYVSSSITLKFHGTVIRVLIQNHRQYYQNYIGCIIDGNPIEKILLSEDADTHLITLGENLEDQEHTVILYKRQDSCHYFTFSGFVLNQNAVILSPDTKSNRRIEFYGDSVTAGEVCEAIEYIGKEDPPHDGEYSDSWYSYASITARNLNAEYHAIAQGGIALLDNTGYFHSPDTIGLLSTYDKIRYNPSYGNCTKWDFSLFTPHIVVIAIGQNDSHPDDYMALDDKDKSANWIRHYIQFVKDIRIQYPNAYIICKTTILCHHNNWDKAIDYAVNEINDAKVVRFKYSNNGCGTPGHIRISEAEQMADELTNFINSLGEEVWV